MRCSRPTLAMKRLLLLVLLICLSNRRGGAAPETTPAMTNLPSDLALYIGTYTQRAEGGVCGARFNAQTGELSALGLLATTPNPSFLSLAPDGRTLYAANEWGAVAGANTGGLSLFRIEAPLTAVPHGGGAPHDRGAPPGVAALPRLVPLASLAVGGGLCHLTTDATGKWLLAAAYGGGTVSVWPVLPDGRLGPLAARQQHSGHGSHPARQSEPHVHHIVFAPDNRRVFVADLGLDQVLLYDFAPQTGHLAPATPPFVRVAAGAGPRHVALSPSCRDLYVVSELNNTVSVFADALGTPHLVQTITTLPPDFRDESFTAEIVMRPDGRFLYVSNRGHNSIVCYAVGGDGHLTLTGVFATGRTPRHFTFDPSGQWLLVGNQSDRSVSVFRVDALSGALALQSQLAGLPDEPVCLLLARVPVAPRP